MDTKTHQEIIQELENLSLLTEKINDSITALENAGMPASKIKAMDRSVRAFMNTLDGTFKWMETH